MLVFDQEVVSDIVSSFGACCTGVEQGGAHNVDVQCVGQWPCVFLFHCTGMRAMRSDIIYACTRFVFKAHTSLADA